MLVLSVVDRLKRFGKYRIALFSSVFLNLFRSNWLITDTLYISALAS